MSDKRDDGYFTLVFKGDIRAFKGNPFKAETPFGIPVAVGVGDAFDRIAELEAKLLDLSQPHPPAKSETFVLEL